MVLQVMISVAVLVVSWAGVAVLGLLCGPWFADSGQWLAVLHVMAVVELLMVKD